MIKKTYINTLLIIFLVLEGLTFLDLLPQDSRGVIPILTFYVLKALWIGVLLHLIKALAYRNDSKNVLLGKRVVIFEIIEAFIFMLLLLGIEYSDYLFLINWLLLIITTLRFYLGLILSRENKLKFIDLFAVIGIVYVVISATYYFFDYDLLTIFEFVTKIALISSLLILFNNKRSNV
ncbi:MAG: hypothetical protein COA33_010780 [Fluviicola sp.]|nr:hypothetical protein [Fluviicola sp.]